MLQYHSSGWDLQVGIKNEFVRNMCDLECFVLSGVPADGTITAEMAFMYGERNRKGATIDYPIGGAATVVGALVRGLEKYGGKLRLKSHVKQVRVRLSGALSMVLHWCICQSAILRSILCVGR